MRQSTSESEKQNKRRRFARIRNSYNIHNGTGEVVRWGPIAGGLCHSWGEIFLFINIWWREHSTVAYHGKHGMPYHTMPWYYHIMTQQSTKTKPTFGEQTPPATLVVVTFDAPSQWPHLSLYCIQGALDRHDGQNSDRIGHHRLDFQRNAFKRERISKGEFWEPKIHQGMTKEKLLL